MAKPSVPVHSGNVSRLTIRTTNKIYLRLNTTASVPRISRSLIVADVALKTMSALTAEIQCEKSTLTGRYVQVSKTTRDATFDRISFNEKCELAKKSNGQKYLHYTLHECQYLANTLKIHKQRAAKVLKQNKDALADAKKRARSRSRSSDPHKKGTRK